MRWMVALLLSALLAGCAEELPQQEAPDETFDDVDVEVTDDTGAIRGVVVDQAIVPLEGATVLLPLANEDVTFTTDSEGRFVFNDVEPGTYFLTISKPAYESAQAPVTVEAGQSTPVVKVQLSRLFEGDPFLEVVEYKGFVGCAYNMFVSSTCVNDYTRIAPVCDGGCAPFVTGIVDQREYRSEVGAGWQSIVWEMNWESSLSGTAEEMGLTVSFADRIGASHWYTSTSQGKPFRLQCDVNIICPEQQDGENGEPMISPDGQDDLWNMISAGDGGVALQQEIEIFQTNFYYAPSPDGWSFLAGDPYPF
ncbi:MAG: carboxypeptidase-like regulatory domain-containing protein [Thermoplasmatota archaeon]